jgi:hypothetical protein
MKSNNTVEFSEMFGYSLVAITIREGTVNLFTMNNLQCLFYHSRQS